MKNKYLIPLAAMLAASANAVDNRTFILPLIWDNDKTVQSFTYYDSNARNHRTYKASFHSVSYSENIFNRNLTDICDVLLGKSTQVGTSWGLTFEASSNFENYIEMFSQCQKEYNNACAAYQDLQKNSPGLLSNLSNLESKLNDPALEKKSEDMANFLETWNADLPIDLNYADKKSDVDYISRLVSTASNLESLREKYGQLSDFIDTLRASNDNEIKTLAEAAYADKENVKKNWDDMTSAVSNIYSKASNLNLKAPEASLIEGKIYFRIIIRF